MLEKEDYISIDTANVFCKKGYSDYIDIAISATLYEVQMWLIKKGLFVNIQYYTGNYYNYEILTIPNHNLVGLANIGLHDYDSYQSALAAGIDEALKLI